MVVGVWGSGRGGGLGFKALLQLGNFLGPDAALNTEIHKNSVHIIVDELIEMPVPSELNRSPYVFR